MDIETSLAKGCARPHQPREPEKVYHKMTTKELAALSPDFGWNVYLEGSGRSHGNSLNVTEPDFFKQMDNFEVDLAR